MNHDKTDATIATPDWEACKTCKLDGKEGCKYPHDVELELYLGDFIICTQYEAKEK